MLDQDRLPDRDALGDKETVADVDTLGVGVVDGEGDGWVEGLSDAVGLPETDVVGVSVTNGDGELVLPTHAVPYADTLLLHPAWSITALREKVAWAERVVA